MLELRVHELAFGAGYLALGRAAGRSEPPVDGTQRLPPEAPDRCQALHQAYSVNLPRDAGLRRRATRLPETAAALVRRQHC
jgi:hypothetical protein